MLDTLPESCQERIAEITQLVFGQSRRHILPTGSAFTVEEVRARQPDTDDFLDVKNLDPKMFATPPADAHPKLSGVINGYVQHVSPVSFPYFK